MMIKEGMYVRCPVDKEYPDRPRQFALGKIIEIHPLSHEVTVAFYDPKGVKDVFGVPSIEKYSMDQVVHVHIQPQAYVRIKSLSCYGTIIEKSEVEEEYYCYYIQIKSKGTSKVTLINEKDLRVPFSYSQIHPIEQLKAYEFHNPIWYNHRQIVSKSIHTLKNATYGFETLLGSRVFLLAHQVDTIVRAIVENPCRLMLADEVGLGKTIQAAVIKKGLQNRLGPLKTLIIAPESLIFQWKNELSYKFWEDIPVWKDSDSNYESQLIFPIEKLNTTAGKLLLEIDWDLCIVDETHQLLKLEEEYNVVFNLSYKIKHILLLTATPIQSRRTEYVKLLSLLEPEKYSSMSESQFDELLEKQSYLSGKIHSLVRDLPDYHEDDLAEDYLEELEEIVEHLNDTLLEELVEAIDIDSQDEGLDVVQLALAYIGEHYQIDRRIIRHRRKELSDKLAKRSLDVVTYPMMGAEVTFFEADTYERILDYLQQFNQSYNNNEENLAEYHRLILSAMFSSPWALISLLQERKQVVQSTQSSVKLKLGTVTKVIEEVIPFVHEIECINELLEITKRWESAAVDEFSRVEELYDDPDLIKGRLIKVLDYASQSVDEKYVVFSSWKETVIALEKVFVSLFGEQTVRTFYKGKTDEELQSAVDDFQKDPNCRFIICDELGGEGRNFQMADEVLHVDLPWSPTVLEQRIGRLDRIGRDNEVLSVVFLAEETLEEELFNLWNKGLEIFNESLSGLEIAIGDILKQIDRALVTNLRYGLPDVLIEMSSSLQSMKKRVEEERYFDMARQLDKHVEEQLINLIEQFDGENGKKLHQTMMSWASLTGLNGIAGERGNVVIFKEELASINSMKKTMLIPPDMKEARRRAKRGREVRGTFLRQLAVQREDLIFYAPGDPFFEAIVQNAYGCELGRSTAFYMKNAELTWRGFVFTWNVTINSLPLIEKGFPLENIVLAQGYIPLESFITYEGLTESDDEVNPKLIHKELTGHYRKQDIIHLGKRSNGRIEEFQSKFPKEDWTDRVEDAYQSSYRKVSNNLEHRIEITRAKNDYQRRIDGLRAANLYYNRNGFEENLEVDKWVTIFEALQNGLKNPKITLDSVAFVWMVKKNV